MRFVVFFGVVPIVAAMYTPAMGVGARAGLMGFGMALLMSALLDAIKKKGE